MTLEELTERMRRRIQALVDSGEVTVTVEEVGRLETVTTRKLDLEEAVVRVIEEIEKVEREAIDRVAAESSELTERERLRKSP